MQASFLQSLFVIAGCKSSKTFWSAKLFLKFFWSFFSVEFCSPFSSQHQPISAFLNFWTFATLFVSVSCFCFSKRVQMYNHFWLLQLFFKVFFRSEFWTIFIIRFSSSYHTCFWTLTCSSKLCLFLKAGAKVVIVYYRTSFIVGYFWSYLLIVEI